MVALKVPVVLLLLIVWWAVRARPEPPPPADEGEDGGGGGSDRVRPHRRQPKPWPHSPRPRGPHGGRVPPPPARTRTPVRAISARRRVGSGAG
jgi:hypothetical protein